jgi:hypothetical protein
MPASVEVFSTCASSAVSLTLSLNPARSSVELAPLVALVFVLLSLFAYASRFCARLSCLDRFRLRTLSMILPPALSSSLVASDKGSCRSLQRHSNVRDRPSGRNCVVCPRAGPPSYIRSQCVLPFLLSPSTSGASSSSSYSPSAATWSELSSIKSFAAVTRRTSSHKLVMYNSKAIKTANGNAEKGRSYFRHGILRLANIFCYMR